MMNKELWRNQWFLSGLILLISLGAGILFVVIDYFITLPDFISIVGLMVAALTTGQQYTLHFQELIPKPLRLRVTIISTIVQIVLAALLIIPLYGEYPLGLIVAGLTFGALLTAAFTYFFLGFGSKQYLKFLEKKKLT